jgi:hypothetical protein
MDTNGTEAPASPEPGEDFAKAILEAHVNALKVRLPAAFVGGAEGEESVKTIILETVQLAKDLMRPVLMAEVMLNLATVLKGDLELLEKESLPADMEEALRSDPKPTLLVLLTGTYTMIMQALELIGRGVQIVSGDECDCDYHSKERSTTAENLQHAKMAAGRPAEEAPAAEDSANPQNVPVVFKNRGQA